MAETVVEIRPIFERLQKELKTVDTRVNKLTRDFNRNSRSSDKASKSGSVMAKAMRAVSVAIAGFGLVALTRGFINVARTFEQLNIRLRTFEGSAEAGRDAFLRMAEVATQTHINVDELVGGFITLRSAGLEPTNAEVSKLADFSAATGRSFNQLSALIFKGAKSTELFTEAGINAVTVGDKLQVTYRGVTEEIDKNAQGIQDYILALVESNGYVGTSAEFANGLTGALSNLTGNFQLLTAEIGIQSGLTDALSDTLASVANYFGNWFKIIADGQVDFTLFTEGLKGLVPVLTAVAQVLGVVAVRAAAAWIAALGPVGLAIIAVSAGLAAFGDDAKSLLGQIVGFFYKAFLDLKTIITTVIPEGFSILVLEVYDAFLTLKRIVVDGLLAIANAAVNFLPEALVPDWVKSAQDSLLDLSDSIQLQQIGITDSINESSNAISAGFVQNAKDANAVVDSFTKIEKAITMIAEVDVSVTAEAIAQTEKAAEVAKEVIEVATADTFTRLELIQQAVLDASTFELDEANRKYELLRELAEEAFGEELLRIEERLAEGMITENAAYVARLDAFKSFEEEKTRLLEEEAKKREDASVSAGFFEFKSQKDFANLTAKERGKQLRQDLEEISKHSRAAFNINKAFRAAEAIQNTYSAVTAALAGPPGPPFSYVFAAGALAAGLAQVAAISSQQFNPPRQFGGEVSAGLPGLVGENGPEVFVPKTDGDIIPNEADDGPSLGGSTVINNTYMMVSGEDFLDQMNDLSVDRSGQGFVGRPEFNV